MSIQIPTAMVQQYSANVQMLVQQKGSRLRRAVRVETLNAENAYFDQVGSTAAVKNVGRHADTPLVDTPHARRFITMDDYDWADLIDKQDRIRTLIDPTSPYAINAMWAMGRAMDDIIIAAATASARTGKTGSTNVPLPAGQKVAVAASGLTLAKLLEAKEKLDAAENDPDEKRYIALRAKDVTTLLNTTEIKSADYNTVKALAAGQLNTFLGFEFIRTQRLIADTLATGTACLAWVQSKIMLGIGMDITVDIGPRRDKRNSTQVLVQMTAGGSRMEEEGVIEIAVTT